MTRESQRLVQRQFGEHAQQFVTSQVHAKGQSLQRLIDLANPQSEWRVLDVATGGGHTALAFSHRARWIVAADLTHQMLVAARAFTGAQARNNIVWLQTDAERLGLADQTFDCITCRIAPHHFPSVESFLGECRRVLVPGGILAIADNIVDGDARVADYVNGFEKLRDPSHSWAHSSDDWEGLLYSAGFSTLHVELIQKDIDFRDWAERMGVRGDNLARLRAMLLQSPERVRERLKPREEGGQLKFTIAELVIVSRKT
jgi:ubiquinone/menaquinone biosynthesis C-methylase UbiE